MTHVFYAYMSDFTLNLSNVNSSVLSFRKERMRLTLKDVAIALKLRSELFNNSSADAILNKSKVSSLTKNIVCSQTL